ncbi:MAG: TonB-dependent receptor [Dechloromonas sp.]|nr:MAG: TonB-dependent receptor [Dechloromonas sp.]
MKNTPFPLTTIAAVLAASFSGVVLAADEIVNLSPVIVSAARVEQSTLEAPANVSVVTSDAIEASGAVRVADALTAKVPSLFLRGGTGNSSRLNSTPVVSMRGQYNRVLMMVDGLSLADGSNGGPASLLGLNPGDVEQIEIVPGVASALYGSNAVGGVVNVITKMPTKQEITARYSRGFGDNERTAFEAAYRNRWENGLALSLSAGYEEMAGFEENELVVLPVGTTGSGVNALKGGKPTTTNTGAPAYIVGDKGATPAHQGFFNAKLYYALDARSRFFAGFSRTEGKQGYEDFNVYVTRNGKRPDFPLTNTSINGDRLGTLNQTSFWNSSNPNRREENRFTAGYDGKLGESYDLKVNLGYFDRKSSFVSSGTGATFDGGPGTMTSAPNITFDGSAQIGTNLGDKHYLLAGVATFRNDLDRKVYVVSDWRHPDDSRTGAVNDENEGRSRTNALFVQDQYFVTDALTLYLGGRYDKWTTRGESTKRTGTPLGTVVTPERSETAFSPKLAAVFRLNQSLSLRGSVGKAFRAPSNFELYSSPNKSGSRLLIADPDVGPEKALSWDVGIEQALPGQGVVKAAYYDTRLTDMIYRKTRAHTGGMVGVTTDAILTNAGEARIKGVELSAETPLFSWLRGSASYTYTDGRITRDESNTGLQDKVLRFVPKNMAALGLDAQWQQWRAVLTATYTGKQFGQEDNSDTVGDVYGGYGRFWLANLNVSYQIDRHLKATVRVYNLFDKTYYEFYQMPGRNAAIELSASF